MMPTHVNSSYLRAHAVLVLYDQHDNSSYCGTRSRACSPGAV
jgi:hypothetical protein